MSDQIIVQGTKTGLPFSKGLMASSLLAVGLDPGRAYRIAEQLEQQLLASGRTAVSVEELRGTIADLLTARVGSEVAHRYLNWQQAQERDRPLILLIGGSTGAGKSTVATQVASKLGITRIVSTDAVRDVMRATISADLLPHLHVSSFEAVDAVEVTSPRVRVEASDPLLTGFLRQTRAVAIGIQQVLRRAVAEQVDTVIEGVHLVPGLLELPRPEEAIVVQVLLCIEDADQHRHNFNVRGQTEQRPRRRYLEHFNEIRRIQAGLLTWAKRADVPIVPSEALDQTIDRVTALMVDTVSAVRTRHPTPAPPPDDTASADG